MAAEHRRITINTQRGAIRLDEQVKVEMLVSRSKISRHHPSRYPLMAVLESGVTMMELGKHQHQHLLAFHVILRFMSFGVSHVILRFMSFGVSCHFAFHVILRFMSFCVSTF